MHWRDGAVSVALTVVLWTAPALAAAADGSPGDANCDGIVDSVDIGALVRQFFGAVSCTGADANGDGLVNGADLIALSALLGSGSTPTPTPSEAAEATATVTPTLAPGPRIVFFGLAGADGQRITSSAVREDGVVVYQRPIGLGFKLVVEAAPGPNGIPVGSRVFVRGGRPDLQIQSTLPLGDASSQVCITGVPPLDPPDFEPGEVIDNTLNDLACNFVAAVNPVSTCTLDEFLRNNFLSEDARIQFCVLVDSVISLPTGEAYITVQLLDTAGNVGERRQILIRTGLPPLPTATHTQPPTVTRTPTNSRPPTATGTATSSATLTRTTTPTRTPTTTRTATVTPTGSRPPSATATQTTTRTHTETRTATNTRTHSPTAEVTLTPTPTGPPPTLTGTRVATATLTRTFTFTSTPSRTRTPSPEKTFTITASPSTTPTLTRTTTPTRTLTKTLTPTITLSPTITRTITRTPTITRTITGSRPPTVTETPTVPLTATRTDTPASTATGTRTHTPTRSATGTATTADTPVVSSPTPTRTPIDSPSPTSVVTATETRTPTISRTPTPTRTPTLTITGTRPVTETPTRTGTVTRTATTTVTSTRTPTRTTTTGPEPSETTTRTPTRTPLPPASVTVTATFTSTRTPSSTQTPSRTPTSQFSPTVTRTPTTAFTPTTTRSSTITRTPTSTRTVTRTGTTTPTGTPTRTRTRTRTPTRTSVPGPLLTYFGIANANGTISQPIDTTNEGIPIFERPLGFGFIIVVEGRRGGDNSNVGTTTFNYEPGDPGSRPDLQIIANRPLGNGSGAVCDNMPPTFGGVPSINPPSFEFTQAITDAINDFGCRFVDGSGEPGGRQANAACVLYPDGEYRFANSQSQIQFCATVSRPMIFPKGDTLLSVRVRNVAGVTGEIMQIVVRSES